MSKKLPERKSAPSASILPSDADKIDIPASMYNFEAQLMTMQEAFDFFQYLADTGLGWDPSAVTPEYSRLLDILIASKTINAPTRKVA